MITHHTQKHLVHSFCLKRLPFEYGSIAYFEETQEKLFYESVRCGSCSVVSSEAVSEFCLQ
jgi:hypothetical protein